MIDVLTILDEHVNFDEVEKTVVTHKLSDAIDIKMVPYDFLIDLKIRSRRNIDLWDVARLDELRNLKNKQ